MSCPLSLSAFARHYGLSRALCPIHAATLVRRAEAMEAFAGEQQIALVLTESNLNGFLASLAASRSPWTIKGYRGDLLTLWNAAADDDLVPYPIARRVRRGRLPDLLVECYTVEEVRALLAHARILWGKYPNGVARKDYWAAAIPLAWDTGFRRGDVWLFDRYAVRPDKTLRIVQSKTKQVATVRLRESTVAALDAVGHRRPCQWHLTPSRFGRHFARIVKGSGVNRGTFKWLRRASGSYVEVAQPGAGHKHLGHRTPAIFARHYDAQLAAASLPMPPEL